MWLLIPILLYCIIYFYIRHVYTHWKRKGYPTERVGLQWHFLKQVYRREFNHVRAVNDAYSSGGRLPFLGIYFFFRPTLLVRDVQLARTILDYTHSHFNCNHAWDHVCGYRKVNLLEKLAPIFAVNRIEGMFRNIEKVAEHMLTNLKAITPTAAESLAIDMQSVLRNYAVNMMGNLIYGLDVSLYEKSDSIFTKYMLKSLLGQSSYSYTLGHLPKKASVTYRLRDLIKESVQRREGGYIRKDILQLLVKYRNGNKIATGCKENWHIDNVYMREKVLSITQLSKVAEYLLSSSLQTVTSATLLTLFEVLQEPLLLQQLLAEIKVMETEHQTSADKLMTFEALESLKYLDLSVQETMRKYPSIPIIERVCSKHFNIPHSRFIIKAGSTVMIPLMALQHDERYFDDPLKYKPQRFLSANEASKDYMRYGLAASVCTAQKFSQVVIKVALLKLLQNFDMDLMPNRKFELTHNPALILRSTDGFKLKIKCRKGM